MDICPKCGLPKEACVCDNIAKTNQSIKIQKVKRKFGKIITIVSGFDEGVDMKDIARELKTFLACGGTVKNNAIELQGDQARKAREVLIKLGFPETGISL